MQCAIIAGRYRLEGQLGLGAFARVFLTWDLRMHWRVAIKIYDITVDGNICLFTAPEPI
ncbi:MAG: hypothetical protein PHT33_00230 [bacterium]|nr:hypothetical protein [bacterium]